MGGVNVLVPITKSARKYGYLIWAEKRHKEVNDLLQGLDHVNVIFNGFNLGNKKIDWKYNRISIGYKFTRALPEDAKYYKLRLENNTLKVESR